MWSFPAGCDTSFTVPLTHPEYQCTQEAKVTQLLSAGPLMPGKDIPGNDIQGDREAAMG